MKTNTNYPNSFSDIKVMMLITLFFLFLSAIQAQTPFVSFQATRDITGSGLGGNVTPSIVVTKNNSSFGIGPNFQRKRMNYSGLQASYRYVVAANYTGKRELFLAGNLLYHSSARMSEAYIDIEKSSRIEDEIDYNALRFKVIESYVGFGLKINPTKKFSTCFGLGMGAFNTLNKDYDREMFREKAGMSLQLNVSLIYSFKNETL